MNDDEKNMTLTGPDGVESAPFSTIDMKRATASLGHNSGVKDGVASADGDELRAFIERFERLEAEKKDLADAQKEVMAETKGRGYDIKIIRKLIALRKRDKDDVDEEEAVLELYKAAMGM